MKSRIVALVAGVAGIVAGWWGISTILHYRSFTEAAEGVVARRSEEFVTIGFHQQRSSSQVSQVQFSGDAEYAFPLNERTDKLKVGDKVEGFYPPGRLPQVRLDRDFSYMFPNGALAIAAILLIAAIALLFGSRPKKTLPAEQ